MDKYKKYVKPYLSAFILGPIFMIVEVLGEGDLTQTYVDHYKLWLWTRRI